MIAETSKQNTNTGKLLIAEFLRSPNIGVFLHEEIYTRGSRELSTVEKYVKYCVFKYYIERDANPNVIARFLDGIHVTGVE